VEPAATLGTGCLVGGHWCVPPLRAPDAIIVG
jgi:hypothetical protein